MIQRIIATIAVALLAVLLVAQITLPIDLTNPAIRDFPNVGAGRDHNQVNTGDEAVIPILEDTTEPVFLGGNAPLDPDAELDDVNPNLSGTGGGFLIK
jgi:hypothetical protein